ncbi:hypothetical protein BHYA_0092g00070 [Botrytis hyacinthi]|uniref:Uncharacterized protein n=1 Tax=Botrytis hyacinthi TaxID=278943 RepID=A0A4Z1GL46_9HELO|nr:hypothetical protein BHYA_0092g00070 [Botrytis hyacinthi]
MEDFDGLDLEETKKSQEAADEIVAQTQEDFVQKFSDEERTNGRLMFKRVRELPEDADYAELSQLGLLFSSVLLRWDVFYGSLAGDWVFGRV